MDSIFEVIDKERTRRLKIFKIFAFISLGLFVVSIILFLLKQFAFNENDDLFFFGVFLIIISLILLSIGFSVASSKYNKFVKDNLESKIRDDVFKGQNFSYVERNGISFKEMNASGIFRSPDEFTTSDTIRTNYKGVDLVLSDYVFTIIETSTDKDGHTTEHRYPFPGRYMSFRIDRDFQSAISIVDKQNNPRVFNLKPFKNIMEFESLDFNEKFYSTATDREKAFYLIRSKELIDFIDLRELYKGKIVNVLFNHTIYFLLAETKIEFKFSIFKKIERKVVNDIYAYYRLPLDIINKLKLDGDKFNATSLDEK